MFHGKTLQWARHTLGKHPSHGLMGKGLRIVIVQWKPRWPRWQHQVSLTRLCSVDWQQTKCIMRRFVSAYINSCSICTTEDNIVYSILFDYLYIYTFIIYLIIKSFNDKTLLYRSRNTILHHLSNTNSILCSPHSPQDISGKKKCTRKSPHPFGPCTLSFNLVLTQPFWGPLPVSSSKCNRSPSNFNSLVWCKELLEIPSCKAWCFAGENPVVVKSC